MPSLLEGSDGVLAVDSVHLQILILRQEVFDGHEAAADAYQELTVDAQFHVNSLGPVSVHAFTFSDEHHVLFIAVLLLIQKLGKLLIYLIKFLGNVNDLGLLKLVVELHELADFRRGRTHLCFLLLQGLYLIQLRAL